MRFVGFISLLASMVLYVAQLFLFTRDWEIIFYGGLGFLWYAALLSNVLKVSAKSDLIRLLMLSGLAAVGLGFVPHRLRFGEGFDIYLALFPLIHFATTLIFLLSRKK